LRRIFSQPARRLAQTPAARDEADASSHSSARQRRPKDVIVDDGLLMKDLDSVAPKKNFKKFKKTGRGGAGGGGGGGGGGPTLLFSWLHVLSSLC